MTGEHEESSEVATLGAGCFWCVEAIYQELDGVVSVESGYSGGASENPTYEQFCRIFAQICSRHGIVFDPAMVEHLRREHYLPRRIAMRGCHPRDLIDQVLNLCRYRHRDPEITTELLDVACRSYFIEDTDSAEQDT